MYINLSALVLSLYIPDLLYVYLDRQSVGHATKFIIINMLRFRGHLLYYLSLFFMTTEQQLYNLLCPFVPSGSICALKLKGVVILVLLNQVALN